ncbi:MAG: MFS transporter [Thermodesulfobacteriota bacterium]
MIDKEESKVERSIGEQPGKPHSGRILDKLLRLRAFEAFRYRECGLILYGQIFVSMGMWMDEVTRGWLIYELTNSAVQLGLVRGIQAIPFLFLSPVAGSFADRYSRKMQLVAAQVLNGLVYGVTALLIFTGRIEPWHVYVTAFLMAVSQTFQQPARASMIADAVPPAYLTNAIGLNAMIGNVSRITGPALAGLLIAKFGTGGAYSVQTAFMFLATLWTVQLHPVRHSSANAQGHPAPAESFSQSILEGWKFSWRNEAVRTGLLAVMFVSLFIVPFRTLLPVFARDLLQVGATGQGLLVTAMGIGALCSAVLIASAGERLPRGMLMLGSVTLYGFILVIFAASPWFQLSMVLMGIAGLCHVHSHALVQTVIQSYSPSEIRGRTMAIFNMSHTVLMVGSILVGALSSLIGARWAVASMSSVGALTMILIYMALPRARLIR